MRCKEHTEANGCRLTPGFECVGEDNCTFYQLEAERLCPSCNKKGASWSGYGKHGGFDYTCWNCGHVWNEPLVWVETPGICLRCGRAYDNPMPEVTYPEGVHEIASSKWCADCNALTMSLVYRESSAFRLAKLYDPLKGGKSHAD